MALVNPITVKVGSVIAKRGLKKAGEQSIELFGYNFINLLIMLGTYYLLAFIIAKYFEAVLFGQGIINDFLKLVGAIPVFPENEIIVKLFSTGFGDQKLMYWDFIKSISILLVTIEWYRFNEMQKSLDGKTSVMTHSVFALIVSILIIITVPKFFTTIKSLAKIGEIQQ